MMAMKGGLPSGYAPLDYVYCDEQQYIDTGVKADNTTQVRFVVETNNTEYGHSVFGCFTQNDGTVIPGTPSQLNAPGSLSVTFAGSGGAIRYDALYWSSVWAVDGESYTKYIVKISFDETYKEDWQLNKYTPENPLPSEVVYWDKSAVDPDFESSDNLLIGYNYSTYPMFSGAMGVFEIRKGGRLVRYYVPVKRLSDNVCGYYDMVEHTFNVSEGTKDGKSFAHFSETRLPTRHRNSSPYRIEPQTITGKPGRSDR